jgi:acetyl esterase/lipase
MHPMKKTACHVVFLALALSVAHVFAGDVNTPPLHMSPTKISECTKAHMCKDLPYGGRQVGKGAVHPNVAQTYDLYLPGNIGEIDRSAPFFLFVHGGTWKGGSKAAYAKILAEMAEQGFVVASMNYVLCNPKQGGTHTFAEMLADIDAMVSHLPTLAQAVGISIPRFAIGGSSAGGHLSLLYAYDGANPSVLGLGLKHAVPVACVFSDCGPSDIASPEFMVAGLDWKKGSFKNWYGLLCVLAGGRYGQENIRTTVGRLAKHSPITLLNDKCPPTICLYGDTGSVKTSGTFKRTKDGPTETYASFWELTGSKEMPPASVGMDDIVATQNYVTLTNGLTKAGVPFAARLEPYPHCKILSRKPETRPWLYENLRKYLKGNKTK